MQLKTISLLLCVAGLGFVTRTMAATNTLQRISIEECERRALLNNHDIQIQRFNPEIARMTLSGSYGSYDPVFNSGVSHNHITQDSGYNPDTMGQRSVFDVEEYRAKAGFEGMAPIGMTYELGLNYDNIWGARNLQPVESFQTEAGIKISQHLLKDFWTDSVRTTIEVNKKNLKITELGVDYAVSDILTQVRQAYYELIYAHEYVRVQEELLKLKKQFYDDTKEKVKAGALQDLDLKLAESEVALVESALITAHNLVDIADNVLKTLMGESFRTMADVTHVPSDSLVVLPEKFDVSESWQRGLTQRPDLNQLRLDIEKADLDVKYRRNQLFPSLDLVAGYGLRGMDLFTDSFNSPLPYNQNPSAAGSFGRIRSRDNPNDLLGVIFQVPLGRTAERANYKLSKLRREQVKVVLKQREEVILRDIDDAIKNARTGLEKIAATRKAVEYAKSALEAEQQRLTGGKSTFYTVLRLQSDLAAAATSEVRAKADYNIAVAKLRFVEGTVLDQRRMKVEIK